jgi:hypothetical protein
LKFARSTGRSPRALQREFSYKEAKELMALEVIEPSPIIQFALYMSKFMALFAESNRDKEKKVAPFTLLDFLMKWRRKRVKKQTEDEMELFARALAEAMPYHGHHSNTSG